ncbi:urea carboxylase system permease [Kineococcus radiotolerans]|uniref:Urea carboxylase system permease n=1 Tax=Kineococcus radiotolerans TaxID=131568 RepID=A0A7W4TK70_KINRA|nr:APC family permease [Kineococcus radiotolerans]MBB2900419.1 urea carboxylase system permease [Kineococcus radiotolerans]
MTVPAPRAHPGTAPAAGSETGDLGRFGYGQQLHRSVGPFASFAAGFSFVSILTTVFQLFGLGFSFGGAGFFWTWPTVFAGQLLVALCFAELAARYPISGAVFQWSSRLAGTDVGWITGWVMVVGQVLTVATAAIALQAVLPSIWSGFQVIGGPGADPSPTSSTGAQNAVVLGVALLVVTTAVNVIGVRLMALLTSAGVVVEILGVAALVIALFGHAERSPAVVATTTGAAEGPYLSLWLASSLMAAYVMVGFDSAGELSEETRAPRATTPRTILRALVVSGIGGALILVGGLIAAPSLTDGTLASQGLASVLTTRLGDVSGRLLLACVAIAVAVCTLAVQTSGSRMVYSMARERAFPFAGVLGRVSVRTGTPVGASVLVGVGAAIALAVNWHQSAVFTALASLCIAMLYLAYLGVTLPLLVRRLRGGLPGGVDEFGRPLFSLGRWGVAVNAAAVVYQVAMVVNLAWPRAAVYDLTGGTWWLRFSALLFIGATVLVGLVLHRRNRARHGGPIVLGALQVGGPARPEPVEEPA